jgi:hypothetical protein
MGEWIINPGVTESEATTVDVDISWILDTGRA